MSERAGQLLVALIVEAAIGYPLALFTAIGHPVSWAARLIETMERGWNRGPAWRRRGAGVALLIVLVVAAGSVGWVISLSSGQRWGPIAIVLAATTGLAQRSLDDHLRTVLRPLRSGDLVAARTAVAAIVGRDTGVLGAEGVAVAAIESLAESFCDGIVAPAFWFVLAGLPGLLACKAINTADSLIGHRDARYHDFGWAAARADDLVNWLPARLSGLLIAVAGGGGYRTMLRDARHHTSPNGGWPEAAMAGALGCRLGGPVSYGGEPAWRAVLGCGPAPGAADLARALRIYRVACLLLWALVGIVAWQA